jgi:hypothetical protein
MDRVRNAGIAIALVALAHAAYADHEHDAPARSRDDTSVTASAGVLAARYRSRLFEGEYSGATLGLAVRHRRYEFAARGAAYQIDRNGRTYRGFGDVMVHGAVTLVERDALAAGVHVMAMLPTGDEMKGLGMGHVMLMPAAWATWAPNAFALGGSIGYARGLGDEAVHAEHGGGGSWPLVDPMTFSEVTFDATAMYTLAHGLRTGARVLGAFPLDDDVRAIGAARVAWRSGRVETTAEAQFGLVGDPVRMRGVVATAVRF